LKNEQLKFKIKKAAIPFKVALASPHPKKKTKHSLYKLQNPDKKLKDLNKYVFSFQSQRQSQRMFKLPYNYTHFSC